MKDELQSSYHFDMPYNLTSCIFEVFKMKFLFRIL